ARINHDLRVPRALDESAGCNAAIALVLEPVVAGQQVNPTVAVVVDVVDMTLRPPHPARPGWRKRRRRTLSPKGERAATWTTAPRHSQRAGRPRHTTRAPLSLIPQCHQRVRLRRATGGQVASDESHERKDA